MATASGWIILGALVALIAVVVVLRWREDTTIARGLETALAPVEPEPWTPSTALQTAGSPCRAPNCPAMRYAPLDEHLITAHHQHDNQKARA